MELLPDEIYPAFKFDLFGLRLKLVFPAVFLNNGHVQVGRLISLIVKFQIHHRNNGIQDIR